MFPGELIPLTVPEVRTTAMPAAVATAWQSHPDHPLVRIETAASGPCHAVSLQETPSETFTACATVILGIVFVDPRHFFRSHPAPSTPAIFAGQDDRCAKPFSLLNR